MLGEAKRFLVAGVEDPEAGYGGGIGDHIKSKDRDKGLFSL